MKEASKVRLASFITLAGPIVICGLALFFIEYIASKIDPVPVNRLDVPLKLATSAVNVWIIEFFLFIAVLELDNKFKWFGFSSESGMGGLYFILFGPVVFILIWLFSRYFNGLPDNARDVFALGAKLGFFSSVLPFFILIAGIIISKIF